MTTGTDATTAPPVLSPTSRRNLRTESGIWIEERGDGGHAVLLIAGLGDPAEARTLQRDHLAPTRRVAAFPTTTLTVSSMALPSGN